MRNPRLRSKPAPASVTWGASVHIGIDVPSSFPEHGISWFDEVTDGRPLDAVCTDLGVAGRLVAGRLAVG
jgi:hypothetical protein